MADKSRRKTPAAPEDGPAMPFNEALKRVWSAPPAPRVKKPAKTTRTKAQ